MAALFISRLDNKAEDAIVVVMQRLHVDDFVSHLLERGGWTHLNLPAIAETEQRIQLGLERYRVRRIGEILHPEREPLTVLQQISSVRGWVRWISMHNTNKQPVPPSGNLIKWSWFPFYDTPPQTLPNDRTIVSWDTALSAKELS